MKKGYELVDLDYLNVKVRKAQLIALYRVKPNGKELAAYLIVYQKEGGQKEYIAIPHPKSEQALLNAYWAKLHGPGSDSSEKLQLISTLVSMNMNWK